MNPVRTRTENPEGCPTRPLWGSLPAAAILRYLVPPKRRIGHKFGFDTTDEHRVTTKMIKQFRVHNPDSTCEVPVPWPRAAVLRGSVGSLELREDPLDASRGTLSAPWSIDQQTFEHLVEYFDNRDDYTVEIEEWLELDEDSWRRFERDSSSTSSAQSLAEKPDVIIERVSIHREDGSEFQVYSTGHILRTVVVDELSAPAIARCLSRAFGTPVTADVRERHESPQNTSAA